MARGWESKSVDEQMAAAEEARDRATEPTMSAEDRARANRIDALKLNRSRTLQSLQSACDRRYRALLETTLADLDNEIAALEGSPRPPDR